MRSIASALLAAIKCFCAAICLYLCAIVLVSGTLASERPRYGGTLRVELRSASVTLDPRKWKPGSLESAASEKLATLLFERLISLDAYGQFQPALAVRWSDDGGLYRRWQFTLRTGVKFSDGTPLTSSEVVAALQPLLPSSLQASASGSTVVIQSSIAAPDLLERLASGPYFVYREKADGTLVGTGPFLASEDAETVPGAKNTTGVGVGSATEQVSHTAGAGTRLHFRANPDAWSGRPFVDAIDFSLGVPALKAMFDLQSGKADIVELSPDLVRRAEQANLRVWASDPVILYALRFNDAQAAASDARLREALSLALDRGTMANVLLQKQAQPAAALLPQWLSGYAFLFSVETNLERAKEIRGELPANEAAAAEPLRLHVDAPGDLAKLLGERVAVNARQAAILVQTVSRSAAHTTPGANDPPMGVHLVTWHYSELAPRAELDSILATYNLLEKQDAGAGAASSSADPEQLYARERRVLEDRRILPLVVQPECAGLGPTVRDWMPARWGEWRLADVWLDLPETAPSGPLPPGASKPGNPAAQSSSEPRATQGAERHGARSYGAER